MSVSNGIQKRDVSIMIHDDGRRVYTVEIIILTLLTVALLWVAAGSPLPTPTIKWIEVYGE